MAKDPMLDKVFLKELFNQKKRYIYAKVTTYDNDENPIESIEGRVTQGSINLDGRSSVRRSCSLTIISSLDLRLEDELNWTLNTKIKVEIGMQNFVDETYDDIIWFNMGFYCISNFSFVKNTSGCTVSLQGKDKMCLLNGDLGGEIYAAVDFGTEYIIDKTTGAVTPRQIPIEDIIREAVYEYAKEPYYNIDVEDIPKFGLFLLDYLGGTPFYILVDIRNVGEAVDFLFNQTVYVEEGDDNWVETQLDEIPEDKLNNIGSFINTQSWEGLARIKLDPNSADTYYACRIESGETCGYEVTDLTYPKESEEDNSLSIGVGGTITQVLDKIVEFLGDYEYFFDVNGRFVFRKKNRTIDTNNWSEIDTNTTGIGVDYDLEPSETNWNFSEEELVTQYNSSQKMGDIRNDFSIWGNKQTAETEVPIHLRYAIDFKPQFYRSIDMSSKEIQEYVNLYPEYKDAFEQVDGDYIAGTGTYSPVVSKIYYSKDCPFKDQIDNEKRRPSEPVYEVDWREIIYQMARDYLKFKHFDQFLSRLDQNNYVKAEDRYLYPKGKTKYEQYYVDLEANWRSLYAPRSQYEDIDRAKMTLVEEKSTPIEEGAANNLNFDRNKPIYIKDLWWVWDYNNPYTSEEGPTPDDHEGQEMFQSTSPAVDSTQETSAMFIRNPNNLSLKKYLDYESEPDEPPTLLHNALSCFGTSTRPGYEFAFGEPSQVLRKNWALNEWLGLASSYYYEGSPYWTIPQFWGTGMGIFCDNKSNNSGEYFELFTDFKFQGLQSFNKRMTKSGQFTGRSYIKTNKFNLILPVKTISYLEYRNVLLPFVQEMAACGQDLNRSFNNIELCHNDIYFDYYKIFKVNLTQQYYNPNNEYHPGDKCNWKIIPDVYNENQIYFKGDETKVISQSDTKYYKCIKKSIKISLDSPKWNDYWEEITFYSLSEAVYECVYDTTGEWNPEDWIISQPDYAYFMIETIDSQEQQKWRPINGLVQVIPTYEGVKYYDTGEFVYKISVMSCNTSNQANNRYLYSRITSFEDFDNVGDEKTYHFSVKLEQDENNVNWPIVNKNQYTDLNYSVEDGIMIRDRTTDYKREYIRSRKARPNGYSIKRYSYFLKKTENLYRSLENKFYPWFYWFNDLRQNPSANSHLVHRSPFYKNRYYVYDPYKSGGYEKDDFVLHLDSSEIYRLYMCKENTANPPGDWDSTKWTKVPERSLYRILRPCQRFANLGSTGTLHINPKDSTFYSYTEVPIEYYQKKTTYEFEPYPNSDWNEEALNNPEQMTFWFDFLHSEKSAQISKYGADKIMDRAKSESKDEVSAICFRDVLNIVYDFGDSSEQLIADATEAQQAIFNVPENFKSNFIVSDKYKSCKDVLDEWMQKYTQQNDAVSISAAPIQFLEPNQRILTPDGEYVINSISFPLTYNGMMNINATKVVEKLQ